MSKFCSEFTFSSSITWLFINFVLTTFPLQPQSLTVKRSQVFDIWAQFHHLSTYSFYACRSQKRKKILTAWLSYYALGSYDCGPFVIKWRNLTKTTNLKSRLAYQRKQKLCLFNPITNSLRNWQKKFTQPRGSNNVFCW